jgi:Flp pilus assembly protein TadB
MVSFPYPRASALVLTLFPLLFFPDNLFAQGQPVENGPHLPVALLFVGAGVLGLVLAYGILRNRTRSSAEKQVSEEATKDLYVKEIATGKRLAEAGAPVTGRWASAA